MPQRGRPPRRTLQLRGVLRRLVVAHSRRPRRRGRPVRPAGRDFPRYFDRVRPSTRWEVVLYVDQGANDEQRAAIAGIFLGRAGGTVARLYGPAIGEVHAVRPARITLDHIAARKRIGVVGYLTVGAEGGASQPGDVRCGIPGYDHPGTELHGDALRSTDPALRWEVKGRRNAAFTTDFDYRSGT